MLWWTGNTLTARNRVHAALELVKRLLGDGASDRSALGWIAAWLSQRVSSKRLSN